MSVATRRFHALSMCAKLRHEIACISWKWNRAEQNHYKKNKSWNVKTKRYSTADCSLERHSIQIVQIQKQIVPRTTIMYTVLVHYLLRFVILTESWLHVGKNSEIVKRFNEPASSFHTARAGETSRHWPWSEPDTRPSRSEQSTTTSIQHNSHVSE